MAALEEHGALVFRQLQSTTTPRSPSAAARRGGKAGPAPSSRGSPRCRSTPPSPHGRVPAGHVRLAHRRRAGRRSRRKATVLSARVVAAKGGQTEFASTYAAYDHLWERRRTGGPLRVSTRSRSQRLVDPDPPPEKLARWREKPDREHPLVWHHRNGRRSLVIGATADHVVGMEPTRAGRCWPACSSSAPRAPTGSTVTSGPSATWSSGTTPGVVHRACPYDPSSSREMHRTTMSGDEPIRSASAISQDREPRRRGAHHERPDHPASRPLGRRGDRRGALAGGGRGRGQSDRRR